MRDMIPRWIAGNSIMCSCRKCSSRLATPLSLSLLLTPATQNLRFDR